MARTRYLGLLNAFLSLFQFASHLVHSQEYLPMSEALTSGGALRNRDSFWTGHECGITTSLYERSLPVRDILVISGCEWDSSANARSHSPVNSTPLGPPHPGNATIIDLSFLELPHAFKLQPGSRLELQRLTLILPNTEAYSPIPPSTFGPVGSRISTPPALSSEVGLAAFERLAGVCPASLASAQLDAADISRVISSRNTSGGSTTSPTTTTSSIHRTGSGSSSSSSGGKHMDGDVNDSPCGLDDRAADSWSSSTQEGRVPAPVLLRNCTFVLSRASWRCLLWQLTQAGVLETDTAPTTPPHTGVGIRSPEHDLHLATGLSAAILQQGPSSHQVGDDSQIQQHLNGRRLVAGIRQSMAALAKMMRPKIARAAIILTRQEHSTPASTAPIRQTPNHRHKQQQEQQQHEATLEGAVCPREPASEATGNVEWSTAVAIFLRSLELPHIRLKGWNILLTVSDSDTLLVAPSSQHLSELPNDAVGHDKVSPHLPSSPPAQTQPLLSERFLASIFPHASTSQPSDRTGPHSAGPASPAFPAAPLALSMALIFMFVALMAWRQRRAASSRTEGSPQSGQTTSSCWLSCFHGGGGGNGDGSGGRTQGSLQDRSSQSLLERVKGTGAIPGAGGSNPSSDAGSGRASGSDGPTQQGSIHSGTQNVTVRDTSSAPLTTGVNHSGPGARPAAATLTAQGNIDEGDGQGVHHTKAQLASHQKQDVVVRNMAPPQPDITPPAEANNEINNLFHSAVLQERLLQRTDSVHIPSGGILSMTFEQSMSTTSGLVEATRPPLLPPPPPPAHTGQQPRRAACEISPQPPIPTIQRAAGRPDLHGAGGGQAASEPGKIQMDGPRSMEKPVSLHKSAFSRETGTSGISGCGFTRSYGEGNGHSGSTGRSDKGNTDVAGGDNNRKPNSGGDSAACGDASEQQSSNKVQGQGSSSSEGQRRSGVNRMALDKSLISYVHLREKGLLHAAFGSKAQAVGAGEHRDLQMSSAARYCDSAAAKRHPTSMLERVIECATAGLGHSGILDRQMVKLIRHIGSGAFGSVYFGLWQGAPVAVKVLLLEDEKSEPGFLRQQRALLEAAIGATLDHPNVAATYAYDCLTLSDLGSEVRGPPKGLAEGGGNAGRAGGDGGAGGGGGAWGHADESGRRPPEQGGAAGAAPGAPGAQRQRPQPQPQQQQQQQNVHSSAADAIVHKLYIVQEFCSGGSLKEMLVARGNGPPGSAAGNHQSQGKAGSNSGLLIGGVLGGGAAAAAALSFAFDVACGLRHVHSARVIHGDVSCGNVLLAFRHCEQKPTATPKGSSSVSLTTAHPNVIENVVRVRPDAAVNGVDETEKRWRQRLEELPYRQPPLIAKVADFGLSMWLNGSRSHASGLFQGTPLYVAPEVYGWGRVSRASDVYSYGVLLLELVYGKTVVTIWHEYHQRQQLLFLRKNMLAGADPGMLPPLDVAALAGHGSGCSPLLSMLRTTLVDEASCPAALRQLVAECLAVNPSQRPLFEQIANELVNIMEGLDLSGSVGRSR